MLGVRLAYLPVRRRYFARVDDLFTREMCHDLAARRGTDSKRFIIEFVMAGRRYEMT